MMVKGFVWFYVKLGLRNCSVFLMLKSQFQAVLYKVILKWNDETKQKKCQTSDDIMGVLVLCNVPLLFYILSLFQPE